MPRLQKDTSPIHSIHIPVPLTPGGDRQLREWFVGKDPNSLTFWRDLCELLQDRTKSDNPQKDKARDLARFCAYFRARVGSDRPLRFVNGNWSPAGSKRTGLFTQTVSSASTEIDSGTHVNQTWHGQTSNGHTGSTSVTDTGNIGGRPIGPDRMAKHGQVEERGVGPSR
jgi:hypothetical protein